MKTSTKLTLSLTVVSVVLGFMVSLGYRQAEVSARLGVIDTGSSAVNSQLTTRLADLRKSNQNADQQLAKITAEVNQFEQQSTGTNAALKQIQTRLQDERILAGSTPVHGPGITVTLNDGGGAASDVEQILTHDWTVKSVISELFTAGAEAVTINGYRVVATSAIECQGPVVSVNGHRLGAPFEIQAIGNPAVLRSALDIQGGILDALRQQGLKVSTPQIDTNVQMPAYTNSLQATTSN